MRNYNQGNMANQFTIAMLIVAAFTAIFLVFARMCKNYKWKESILGAGIICISTVTAFLIITGFDVVDYPVSRAVMWDNHIISLSAILTVTALHWRQLYLLNRNA